MTLYLERTATGIQADLDLLFVELDGLRGPAPEGISPQAFLERTDRFYGCQARIEMLQRDLCECPDAVEAHWRGVWAQVPESITRIVGDGT